MSATASDFIKWAADAKTRDDASLAYIVRDCREAAEAMRGWNPDRENFYVDQACTYADEIRRRKLAKKEVA